MARARNRRSRMHNSLDSESHRDSHMLHWLLIACGIIMVVGMFAYYAEIRRRNAFSDHINDNYVKVVEKTTIRFTYSPHEKYVTRMCDAWNMSGPAMCRVDDYPEDYVIQEEINHVHEKIYDDEASIDIYPPKRERRYKYTKTVMVPNATTKQVTKDINKEAQSCPQKARQIKGTHFKKQLSNQTSGNNKTDMFPIDAFVRDLKSVIVFVAILASASAIIYVVYKLVPWILARVLNVLTVPVELIRNMFATKKLDRNNDIYPDQASWFIAAENGDIDAIENMVNCEDHDVNLQRQSDGETCLTIACRIGRLDIVQVLLSHIGNKGKCDVSKTTLDGDSALTISAGSGQTNIVSRLLQCSWLNLDNGLGEQSIKRAIQADYYEVALKIYKKFNQSDTKAKGTNFVYLKKATTIYKAINSKKLADQTKKEMLKQLQEYKTFLLQTKYKKSLDVLHNIDSSALNDLLSFGECYICYDSMLNRKIFACVNDHWVCEKCMPQTKCPTCQVDLINNPLRRCYTVEKVVAKMSEIYQISNNAKGTLP